MNASKYKRPIQLLLKIINGNQTNQELVEFYNFVVSLSLSYLAKLQKSGLQIRRNGDELHEIAGDCVVDLFARNECGFCIWQRHVELFGFPNEKTAYQFFCSIVLKRTRQSLARIFYHRDSIGSKIHRNIKRDNDGYVVKNGFAVHVDDLDMAMPEKQGVDFVLGLYKKSGCTTETVNAMLNSIPKNGHARALPLTDLKSVLRMGMIPGKRVEVGLSENNQRNREYDEFELVPIVEDHAVDPILRDRIHKIIDNFCQDPANNRPWHENDYWPYAPVMKSYWDNFLQARYESVFDCFRLHFPEKTYKEFRENHVDRTDYLLRIVRSQLEDYLGD